MAGISYDQTTAFGSKVYLSAQALASAKANLARVKAVMDDYTAGGVTPANLESNIMFKVAAGQGANFYNAVVSINAAIQTLQAAIDLDLG